MVETSTSVPILGFGAWDLRGVTDGSCHRHGLAYSMTIYKKAMVRQEEVLDEKLLDTWHLYGGEGYVRSKGVTAGMAKFLNILMILRGIRSLFYYEDADLSVEGLQGAPCLGCVNFWNREL